MSIWLREDTAATIVLGPFVDPTTPATEEEALTINQAAVRLSKNGGAFAQKNDATSATHMENGFYSCPLNATDTSTPGSLVVAVDDASALIWWKEYHVVPQQVWDSLFSTDRLQVHAAEISADLITATAIATGAIDADAIAANAIDAAKIADGAIDAATFATGAITATAIAADAITAAKVADGTIDAATFAAGAITAAAIADNAINAASIASDAITAAKIADGAIDAATFAAGAITATVIATGAIDADALATDAVTEIQAGLSTFDHATDQVLLTTATQDQINAIEASFSGIGVTFVTTGTPSTTSINISGANLGDTNGDHNRQLCVFTSGGDGVIGISRWITTFTNTGEGTGTLAFSGGASDPDGAWPTAPGAGVTGIILGRR